MADCRKPKLEKYFKLDVDVESIIGYTLRQQMYLEIKKINKAIKFEDVFLDIDAFILPKSRHAGVVERIYELMQEEFDVGKPFMDIVWDPVLKDVILEVKCRTGKFKKADSFLMEWKTVTEHAYGVNMKRTFDDEDKAVTIDIYNHSRKSDKREPTKYVKNTTASDCESVVSDDDDDEYELYDDHDDMTGGQNEAEAEISDNVLDELDV